VISDFTVMFIELTCFSDGEKNPSAVKEGRPAWMRTLHGRCAEWLSLLPASLAPLRRTLDNIKDPLYRYRKTGLISSVGDPFTFGADPSLLSNGFGSGSNSGSDSFLQ
jgi:hypothetical protein